MNARLSIKEACEKLGISRETLRKRYLLFGDYQAAFVPGRIRAAYRLNGRVACWAQDVEALLSTEVRNV